MSANTVTPYENSAQGKKQQVTQMFNTISGTYDGLNRVISWGSDIKWRKFVVQKVAEIHPSAVLDVATGTGDLAIALTEIKRGENHWIRHLRGNAICRTRKR